MSLMAHLAELEKRHRDLERRLQEALHHPSADDIELAELKRRKLQLKDQIRRLNEKAQPAPSPTRH